MIEGMARCRLLALLLLCAVGGWVSADSPTTTVPVRGKNQTLHLYGPRAGPPVVVSSGDGGWIPLGPVVAEFLGSQGYSVVGVDAKAYLSSFTSGTKTLAPSDVPGDYTVFVEAARQGRSQPVILVGVSEGAGLSVLAASNGELQPLLGGVLALGLPDRNELGWRFRDSIIYVTKGVPNEPLFQAADYVPQLGSLPLAAIHSTRDEFVPLAETRRLLALPGGPKRLWTIEAADHRFSDKPQELQQRLLEALAWIKAGGR